ncbi:BQ2448_2650 [Microbotryum intermedium]|uniref:BQ2448_2650 protein n=1 Tax=Microbotryum intermedium TaxID=269621 RepID=A0A238F6Z4_9BASI|nr:BQ2448_2650 [Microbotryum intermedium]
MSRPKGSATATELLQAIVDDVGHADDLKGVTGLLHGAVRDLLAIRHDASSLPKAAAFFSSPEGAVGLLVAKPASTLRLFSALLDHTNTQIRKLLDPENKDHGRFVENKVALGQAWDLVLKSILLSFKAFLDPTEARAKPFTAHDEDLLGMICYASLIRVLTADRMLPEVQRCILDIFEYSTHLCVENKNRLIRPEVLGAKRLASFFSSAEDYGVTSRALELAFRLRSHLARTSTTAAASISSWEAALFSSAVFGPEESQKLRGMFHRLKARAWEEASSRSYLQLALFKLIFAVTLHANHHRFLCTDLDKFTEDFQDFVAFNQRFITANVVSFITDTKSVPRMLEAPLSSIRSVELFDPSEDYMTCRIILSRSPTVDSTPLKLPQNEADPSLTLGIRLSDVQRLQQILVMRKIRYNARAPEQPAVTERDMAHAERKVDVESPRPEERPPQHNRSTEDSVSPARRQLDSPNSSPDRATRPTMVGPKRVPRKASEMRASTTAAETRQAPRHENDSDNSSDLPKVTRGKTPASRQDVPSPRTSRPPPRPQTSSTVEPKRRSTSRQKMPWDDETPENIRKIVPERKDEFAGRRDDTVPFDREDSDMGGMEPDFDPGFGPGRQETEMKDDRVHEQGPPFDDVMKRGDAGPTTGLDESREEQRRDQEREQVREERPRDINKRLIDDPNKENRPTAPAILTRSKAAAHRGALKVDPISSANRSPLAPRSFDFRRHKTGIASPPTTEHPRPQKRLRTALEIGPSPLAKRARAEPVSALRKGLQAMQDEEQSKDVLMELAKRPIQVETYVTTQVVLRKHHLRKNEQASHASRSRPAITAAARHAAGEMQEMTVSIASAAHQLSMASCQRTRNFNAQAQTIRSNAQRAVDAVIKKQFQG